MTLSELIPMMLSLGGVLAAYFKLSYELERKLTEKNYEQDIKISELSKDFQQEKALRREQLKGLFKKIKNKILSQDESLTALVHYVNNKTKTLEGHAFVERESRLGVSIMRDFMKEDESLSGTLTDETFH